MREFAHEFVDEFFANFVHEFKYEIHTNSYELFARKIGYVTNGLYCKSYLNCLLLIFEDEVESE